MAEPTLQAIAEIAADLAWQAGRRTLAYFQAPIPIEEKDDGTPVTLADREAEQLLRSEIRRRFPKDGLIGEEYGEDLSTGETGRTWILDPIDGTKSFVHGVPLYAVLIGVTVDRGSGPRAKVGVIHLPGLGESLVAWRGGGCWWNGRRARVSETRRIADSTVLTSDFPSHEQPDSAKRLYRAAKIRRTWGDAYGYSLVATGRADVMVDPIVSAWDVAAVQPILEEAGGRFTDLTGAPTHDLGSGVGTNGHLHDDVLSLLDP